MKVNIDITEFVHSFKTEYVVGFTSTEVKKIFNMFSDISEEKFNNALFGITAPVVNGQTLIYKHDILLALICAIENRERTELEND